MEISLIGWIEPIPPQPGLPSSGPTKEIAAAGSSYDEAYDALRAQVPNGWRLTSVRRDSY